MNKSVKIALISALTLLPLGAVAIYGVAMRASKDAPSQAASDYKEIDWRLLRELDYKTGAKTAELEAIDGKPVKLPGFVVPLDDDVAEAAEFLLVPSPQACIHVPPPPPNQMVMVRMKGKAPQRSWGPVWIKGRIFVASQNSQYGKISYMMQGDLAEPYRTPEDAEMR